jgi:hypothetical protein
MKGRKSEKVLKRDNKARQEKRNQKSKKGSFSIATTIIA